MNLSKEQIELLLKSARSPRFGENETASPGQVEPYDFQGERHLSAEQVGKIVELHADFAKQLSRLLTSIVCRECKVSVTGGEQISYSALLEQFPDSVAYSVLHVDSPEGKVFVQCDFTTVLTSIDLMLGGDGAPIMSPRALTAVEQEMFEPIVKAAGDQLRATWSRSMTAEVRVAYCSDKGQVAPANEGVFVLKCDVRVAETQGTWLVVVPTLVLHAIMLKIEQETLETKSQLSDQHHKRLKERVLDSCFAMELLLPPSHISVRELAHLKRGQVIVLKPRSSDPIHFNVAGINLFHASPVSCGTRRGAQVRKVLSIVRSATKEAR